MDFQQSQTYKNLQNAYANELQSSTKYNIFSIAAEREDYIKIQFMFNTASRNERFISERLRRLLLGGERNTSQNLEEARDDSLSSSESYRDYSRIARDEGFNDIASLFSGIANIKLNHNSAFQNTIDDIRNNQLFCQPKQTLWVCLGCGNILSGECAPAVCPICGYPQGYYEVFQP